MKTFNKAQMKKIVSIINNHSKGDIGKFIFTYNNEAYISDGYRIVRCSPVMLNMENIDIPLIDYSDLESKRKNIADSIISFFNSATMNKEHKYTINRKEYKTALTNKRKEARARKYVSLAEYKAEIGMRFNSRENMSFEDCVVNAKYLLDLLILCPDNIVTCFTGKDRISPVWLGNASKDVECVLVPMCWSATEKEIYITEVY